MIREFRRYNILKKIILKNTIFLKELATLKIRYNYLYELYTVFNIPKEVLETKDEKSSSLYILSKVQEINHLLVQYQLSEIVYPIIKKIDNSNYLFILTPFKTCRNIVSTIGSVIFYIITYFLFFTLFKISSYYNPMFVSYEYILSIFPNLYLYAYYFKQRKNNKLNIL